MTTTKEKIILNLKAVWWSISTPFEDYINCNFRGIHTLNIYAIKDKIYRCRCKEVTSNNIPKKIS